QAFSNVRVVSEPGVAGEKFIPFLDSVLNEWTPDLLIVDPLFGFLGGDVKEQAVVGPWIRNGIKPLLRRYRCAHVMVHHTNKPVANGKKLEGLDLLYQYAGSAELANSYRAAAILHRTDKEQRIYDLAFPRRTAETGLRDQYGDSVSRLAVCWSKRGGWGWQLAESVGAAPSASAKPAKSKDEPEHTSRDLLALLPDRKVVSREGVRAIGKESLAAGRNRVDGWLSLLTEEALIEPVEIATS